MTSPETTHHYLPSHRTTLTITHTARADGVVTYTVTGRDFTGTVAVEPWVTDELAIPDQVAVNLGEGGMLADLREGLPAVNGITHFGRAGPIGLGDSQWPRRLRVRQRQTHRDHHSSAELRDAKRYLLAVLNVIARQHQQLDQTALMRAAAMAWAGRRLARCGHRILSTHDLFLAARSDLRDLTELAAQLQALSPLPLLPPEPSMCRCWHGQVDPEVFLAADDDGDWLICPACRTRITMLEGGDRLGSLLGAVAGHRCP